jgi:excisionase family DNA binding protein
MTVQKTIPIPRLLSIAQVALYLGVSQKTVRRLIKDGQLPSHRIRGQLRTSEADLARYLAHVRFIGV